MTEEDFLNKLGKKVTHHQWKYQEVDSMNKVKGQTIPWEKIFAMVLTVED